MEEPLRLYEAPFMHPFSYSPFAKASVCEQILKFSAFYLLQCGTEKNISQLIYTDGPQRHSNLMKSHRTALS